jgi:hypothetical protein
MSTKWQWVDKVSPETSFRVMRAVSRSLAQPATAKWRETPTLLGLLVDRRGRDPNLVVGGPEAIENIIRSFWRPDDVRAIRSALDDLWNDPRREESSFALVIWQTGRLPEMVALDVRAVLGPLPEASLGPSPLAASASPKERQQWLRKLGQVAIDRVGGANMRACAARDEVALVAVEPDGSLSYGYAPRSKYLEDFPEPVRLRPGETAACHAILLDMGLPGDQAPYQPFRMCAVRHASGRGDEA